MRTNRLMTGAVRYKGECQAEEQPECRISCSPGLHIVQTGFFRTGGKYSTALDPFCLFPLPNASGLSGDARVPATLVSGVTMFGREMFQAEGRQ
jgi:hypothetical protein